MHTPAHAPTARAIACRTQGSKKRAAGEDCGTGASAPRTRDDDKENELKGSAKADAKRARVEGSGAPDAAVAAARPEVTPEMRARWRAELTREEVAAKEEFEVAATALELAKAEAAHAASSGVDESAFDLPADVVEYAGDPDNRKEMMAHRRAKQEAEARAAKLKDKAKLDLEMAKKKAKASLSAATVRCVDVM